MTYCPQCGTSLSPNAFKVGRCPACHAPLFSYPAEDGTGLADSDAALLDKEQSFYYPRAAAPLYPEYAPSPYMPQDREPPPPPQRRRRVIALSLTLALLLVGSVVLFATNIAPRHYKSAIASANATPLAATMTIVPTTQATSGTIMQPTVTVSGNNQPQATQTPVPLATPLPTLTPVATPAMPAQILITPASYHPSNCFGATTTFQLANVGGTALNWIASPSDAFLAIYPKSGMLAPGASVVVQVSGLTGTSPHYVITIADPRAANSPQQFTISCS